MTSNKRFYWLKLMKDFFSQPKIKKLRKIAGGDTYTIIYLKLQLISIDNNATIEYQGIEPTFEEEMALTIDEDVDNVSVTLNYLMSQGLIVKESETTYVLTETMNLIGSENKSTERVRKLRERKKDIESVTNQQLCNADVTLCNTNVTPCNVCVTTCNTEIEIEKEIELDKELELEIEKESDKCADAQSKPKRKVFVKPTSDQIIEYCNSIGHGEFDADEFIDYYESKDWKVGRERMKDWKATVRNWIRRREKNQNQYSHMEQKTHDWRPF